MLKVNGRVNMVKKAGMASSRLSHGICLTSVIIRNPTTIRAGAVTGETNRGWLPPTGYGRGVEREVDYLLGRRDDTEDHAYDARGQYPDNDAAPEAPRHERERDYEP